MPFALGKRKRKGTGTFLEARAALKDPDSSLDKDIQAVFKRHFEAQFEPLPTAAKQRVKVVENVYTSDDSDGSEWNGISEDGQVEVIEHRLEQPSSVMSKEELKEFMSSKPPIDLSIARSSKSLQITDEDDLTEAANVKKDLALQRLLAESHLLDSANGSNFVGNNRHKIMDLRLQAGGAKISILEQENMPMSHRKGIKAKQSEHEERRRKEARENGIILEKAKMRAKTPWERRRETGVGGPGVGRFRGGTLKLSKKDILDIEGSKRKTVAKAGMGRSKRKGNARSNQR